MSYPFGILNIRQSDVTNKNPEGVMIYPSLARRRGITRPRRTSSAGAMWSGVGHQRLMEASRIAAYAFGGLSWPLVARKFDVPRWSYRVRAKAAAAHQQSDRSRFVSDRTMA